MDDNAVHVFAMDTSEPLELPEVTVETIHLQIENFLNKLTLEQWNLLKLETPDNVTKLQLAELILLMTSSLSLDLMKAFEHYFPLSVESFQSSLEDTLRKNLAKGNTANSVRLDQLTKMIAEEMTERVNYYMSLCSTTANASEPSQFERPTPNKLEKMVCCVCKVLKRFAADIEGSFQPKLESQKAFELMQDILQELMPSPDSGPPSHCSSLNADRLSNAETAIGTDLKKSGTVQKIIFEEASDIMAPLIDEMSEADVSELIFECSQEFKATSDEISQMISEEESLQSSDLGGSSRFSESHKRISKAVEKKIKNILATFFATVSIIKMGAQVKKEFAKKAKEQSRETIKFLIASVENLLLRETKLRVSPDKAPILTDVLYRYVIAEPLEVTQEASLTASVPKAHRRMYADIQKRALNSLPLMNWWFSKQACDYTSRMTSALMEIKSSRDLAETRKKNNLSLVIVQLVALVNVKSKVNLSYGNPANLAQDLFKKTWAEVQDIDFDLSPERINTLHKPVFKDLLKKWVCPELLLLCICKKEPEIERSIIDTIKRHLIKEHDCTSGFISSLAALFKQ